MGFRDDHEAARARIDALERELASLKRAPGRNRVALPPLLMAVVAIAGGVFVAIRAEDERRAAQAAYVDALEEANAAIVRARADAERVRSAARSAQAWERPVDAADPPPAPTLAGDSEWYGLGEARATWMGHVTERIGDTPAGIGATCRITLLRRNEIVGPHSAPHCDVTVVCDDRTVYSSADESAQTECWHDGRHFIVVDRAERSERRVRVRYGTVRIDDGASGTWSFAFGGG